MPAPLAHFAAIYYCSPKAPYLTGDTKLCADSVCLCAKKITPVVRGGIIFLFAKLLTAAFFVLFAAAAGA